MFRGNKSLLSKELDFKEDSVSGKLKISFLKASRAPAEKK